MQATQGEGLLLVLISFRKLQRRFPKSPKVVSVKGDMVPVVPGLLFAAITKMKALGLAPCPGRGQPFCWGQWSAPPCPSLLGNVSSAISAAHPAHLIQPARQRTKAETVSQTQEIAPGSQTEPPWDTAVPAAEETGRPRTCQLSLLTVWLWVPTVSGHLDPLLVWYALPFVWCCC